MLIPREGAEIIVRVPKKGTCYTYIIVDTKDLSNIKLYNKTLNMETVVDSKWFDVPERKIEIRR